MEDKKKLRDREEKEFRNLRNEAKVWKVINRKREKNIFFANSISVNRWEKHFKELLEGSTEESENREVIREIIEERKIVMEDGNEGEEKKDISEEEIREAMTKMKKGKASGIDEISWKLGGIWRKDCQRGFGGGDKTGVEQWNNAIGLENGSGAHLKKRSRGRR